MPPMTYHGRGRRGPRALVPQVDMLKLEGGWDGVRRWGLWEVIAGDGVRWRLRDGMSLLEELETPERPRWAIGGLRGRLTASQEAGSRPGRKPLGP